jgi:hypothetical protein
MSSAECRFRPAIRLIVPSSPASGRKTLNWLDLFSGGDRVMLDVSKGVIDIEVDDASAYFDGELGVAGPLL